MHNSSLVSKLLREVHTQQNRGKIAPLSPVGTADPGLSLVLVSAEELISSKDWRSQDSKRNCFFGISPWSAVC